MSAASLTRRDAARRALAAGGAALGGSAAAALLDSQRSDAAAAVETDGQVVYDTLAVEQLVLAGYERVIASGKLSGDSARLAHRMLSYERTHVRFWSRELRALGMAEPPSLTRASTSQLDAILSTKQVSERIAAIGDEADALELLIRLEEVAEGAYYRAIGKFADPRLLSRSAQIMAAEAQHRTVLSEARDPGDVSKAVPVAFVQGRG